VSRWRSKRFSGATRAREIAATRESLRKSGGSPTLSQRQSRARHSRRKRLSSIATSGKLPKPATRQNARQHDPSIGPVCRSSAPDDGSRRRRRHTEGALALLRRGSHPPLSALPRADRSASLRRRRCGRLTQHGAAHAFNARFGAASGAFGRRPRAAISPGDRPCCRPGIGKRPASVESRTPVGIQCIVAPATRLARSNWRERDLWLTRR
jgi:hypothetical protein